MEKIAFDKVISALQSGKLSPFNFYNVDIKPDQYFAYNHYKSAKHDTIDAQQILHKCFLDIEVFGEHSGIFPNPEDAKFMINAVTIYFSSMKKYRLYCILPKTFPNLSSEEIREHILKESRKKIPIDRTDDSGNNVLDSYIREDEDLDVFLFEDDLQLLDSLWGDILENDPAILSSFNGDIFDYPYMYYRYLRKLGDPHAVSRRMSRFGDVYAERSIDRSGKTVQTVKFPEFVLADQLYLYKPRDDGGLNLGQKLVSFKLDNIAYVELGLKKKEYASEGYTLDQFYEKDPLNFFLYNTWDVALIVKLDRKLGMVDLYNMQRRVMKTALSNAMHGASGLFDTFVISDRITKGLYVRWGINQENKFEITDKAISKIVKPKSKTKWDVVSISAKEVSQAIIKFVGAYVKKPKAGIYTGVIPDFDASRLYPSMMLQHNISIDTFFGRIVPRKLNKTFVLLDKYLGHLKSMPNSLYIAFFDYVDNYIKIVNPAGKMKVVQKLYFILVYLFQQLLRCGKTLKELMVPKDIGTYVLCRTYLVPFLETIEMCSPDQKEYCDVCYDYIINNEELDEPIVILENYTNPHMRFVQIQGKDLREYLESHKVGVTLAGTLFMKHEENLSMFYTFLNDMYLLRKKYKKMRASFPENSDEYVLNDRRQNCTKILMNTTYGLHGMTSFRFSNKWIASSITVSGRVALKTAQYYADLYLKAKYS